MSASQLQRLLITAAAVALAGCGASQTGGVDATVWQAVERGDVAAVAKNLGGASLANSTNTAGNSLLYEAVASPDLAVARLLLAKGADANQRNQFGRTPLHRAADEDRLEVVRLLLANGADVRRTRLPGIHAADRRRGVCQPAGARVAGRGRRGCGHREPLRSQRTAQRGQARRRRSNKIPDRPRCPA